MIHDYMHNIILGYLLPWCGRSHVYPVLLLRRVYHSAFHESDTPSLV